MNSEDRWLADRTIVAVSSTGERSDVTLRIGLPREVAPNEWACAVAMEGLHHLIHPVHGVDAWQALQLALSLQAQLLGHFVDGGGQLLGWEEQEAIEPQSLFPNLPPRG